VACVYLPLVLGMGLVEVEAVAEHDPRRDCDLGPATTTATKMIAFVRVAGTKQMQSTPNSLRFLRVLPPDLGHGSSNFD
jgi:hypothetical protein